VAAPWRSSVRQLRVDWRKRALSRCWVSADGAGVGKRQRHTEFIGYSIEDLERQARDKSKPAAERLKAVAELKFQKARNTQKRSK
jgi:hypothetical protein